MLYDLSGDFSSPLDLGQHFSVKVQRTNTLGFSGHMVSVATTQLCH